MQDRRLERHCGMRLAIGAVLIGGALSTGALSARPARIACHVDVAAGIRMAMSQETICTRLSARLGEALVPHRQDRIVITLTFASDAVMTARMARTSRHTEHVFDPISIQTHDRAINIIEIDQLADALLTLLKDR